MLWFLSSKQLGTEQPTLLQGAPLLSLSLAVISPVPTAPEAGQGLL